MMSLRESLAIRGNPNLVKVGSCLPKTLDSVIARKHNLRSNS
ncbi:hypothetical protein [Helicobacter ganmani]